MKSKKNSQSQVNNADDEQESGNAGEDRAGVRSKQLDCYQSYCLYYPFEMNSTCQICNDFLGTTSSNIEKHLKSHGIDKYDYKCGACNKSWPSWRSAMTHYSKSNCRLRGTSTTTSKDTHTTTTSAAATAKTTTTMVHTSSQQVTVEVLSQDGEPKADDETSSNVSSQAKEEPKLLYCRLCASGGWTKSVSLSQHMRRMHPTEYNASIEVPTVKRRWTDDETQILAQLEASIPSSDGLFMNQMLASKFPSRTFEAIKSHRKKEDYRALVEQFRTQMSVVSENERSNCIYNDNNEDQLSHVNTNPNSNPNPNTNNNGFDGDDDLPVVQTITTAATTTTTINVEEYPDIRRYLKTHVIDGKVQLCNTMKEALIEYVNNIPHTDPVNKSHSGICEMIKDVPRNPKDPSVKTNDKGRRKGEKSKKKAQQYAHCQRLFKTDKSKLASELFDNVDTTAKKPPLSDAYEHFRQIWETDAFDKGAVEQGNDIGTDILLAPITREDIQLAISQTKSDTAVGPDRISLDQIRSISKNELWCAFNIWLGSRRIPSTLKINRTALLPKTNEGLENIKNWRPITIASLLIRLYNKILARRMQLVFRTSQKQTGFKPMNGVGQNTSLLHNLLRHARTNKNNLYACLLDVSKAFDSIPHDSIKRALIRNGCPPDFVNLVSDQYNQTYTRITYGSENSKEILLKRGVKQGDPMSSILFNIVIDELFQIIGERFGYEIEGVGSVNARAFADDIALISGTEIGMKELLTITETFLSNRGLEINVKKCVAICLRKAGKMKKSQVADSTVKNPPILTVNNEPIRLLGINEQCKYLGIHYTPLGAVDPKTAVIKLRSSLASLSKAPLKPQQKVLMLRIYLIPRFIHSFTYTECYPKLMGQQDRLVRRWLKQILKLPASISTDFFYLPIKEGGLGIAKFHDVIGTAKLRLHGMLTNSGDVCLRYLVETQSSAMHARWCQTMGLPYRPSSIEVNSRQKILLDESRSRYAQTVHGGGYDVFRVSPITNRWLSGYTKIMRGSTYIRCIQMRTNTIPTRVTTTRGQQTLKTCRRCGLADETLIHILQTCPITQRMRCTRHNNVCRMVADKLCSKGYNVHAEQGIPSPGLQTNISRPDLIAIKNDEALVLDVTCVYETSKSSLHDAYRRKIDRYAPLSDTIKQKFKVNHVSFYGLCVGSRGAYDPKHLSIWHSLGFSGNELMVIALRVMENSLRTIKLFNNANRLCI